MPALADIVGQEQALGQLRAALTGARPHHAYLFEGPEGVGKGTAALALAQALNCLRRPSEGCAGCDACLKIRDGLHPDVISFEVLPEKGQAERVRGLLPSLAFAPHEGRARVVVIDPADGLNTTSANVLLKTLEEPPPSTHFVLVSSVATQLLETIRSRCQRVRFRALATEEIAPWLVAHQELSPAAAQSAAELSGGSLGRALALAESDDLSERSRRVDALLVAVGGSDVQRLEAAAEWTGEREESTAALELLWLKLRDVLWRAEGLAGEPLAQSPRNLMLGLRATEEARQAIEGFVNPQLAMEHLLLRLAQLRVMA